MIKNFLLLLTVLFKHSNAGAQLSGDVSVDIGSLRSLGGFSAALPACGELPEQFGSMVGEHFLKTPCWGRPRWSEVAHIPARPILSESIEGRHMAIGHTAEKGSTEQEQ